MYAKLFAQVLSSSLNETEPVEVRGVFFLLLAAADKDGNVLGSDATIARIINVPMEQFRSCIEALMKPDPQSRCELHEGRRVVPMERGLGYLLPAYPKYSGITTDEERREYFRVKKAESRARLGTSNGSTASRNKPQDLNDCLLMAARIGMSEAEAKKWYADMETANWSKMDGTPFGNWPREMTAARDRFRAGAYGSKAKPRGKHSGIPEDYKPGKVYRCEEGSPKLPTTEELDK